MIYQAPGINDAESKLYKDYDKIGRNQNAMLIKANMIGVNNLKTTQYRHDSPINSMAERFPDKFVNYNSNKRVDTTSTRDDKVQALEQSRTLMSGSCAGTSPRFKLNESQRFKPTVVDNVFPALPDQSMGFLEGMFKTGETFVDSGTAEVSPEKLRERQQFLERTMAENQFILEASFCAVS